MTVIRAAGDASRSFKFAGRVTKLVDRTVAARLLLAAALGLTFAVYTDVFRTASALPPSDFYQPRVGGELLLKGENPYTDVGPDRRVPHAFYMVYPAPAAVVAMPFTWLPERMADASFVGLGAALLAWALTRRTLKNPQLLVFASFAMTTSAQNVQWSPLLTAATALPWLGVLYACKPSVAVAYLVAYPSRAAVIAAGLFTLVTVAIWPSWPMQWLSLLGTVTHMSAPVMRPGGVLLLLALLRWRRPEARLLAALACIPHTPVMYEALPLFLIVGTLREGMALTILMAISVKLSNAIGATYDYDAWMTLSGSLMLWLVYLPCLAMVLRRPPGGGEVQENGSFVNREAGSQEQLPFSLSNARARQ